MSAVFYLCSLKNALIIRKNFTLKYRENIHSGSQLYLISSQKHSGLHRSPHFQSLSRFSCTGKSNSQRGKAESVSQRLKLASIL